jgi:hypothetical protein
MVKSILQDYRKVASPVEVRVSEAGGDHDHGHTLWGADEKNLVLMGKKDGFPSPRSIPWKRVERLEITLSE